MSATGLRKHRQRLPLRNKKGKKRERKVEVKLSTQEHRVIRKKFGRQAAAIARAHWLGFRVANPTTPDKKHLLAVARALHAHRVEVIKLRRLVADAYGENAAKILKDEETKFNHLTHLWLSIYSAKANSTPSPEE
jgi:hypothetical protein